MGMTSRVCRLDSKLKAALLALKKLRLTCSPLLEEIDDSEIEIQNMVTRNSMHKHELAELTIEAEELLQEQDSLQSLVDSYDPCQDTYEAALQ